LGDLEHPVRALTGETEVEMGLKDRIRAANEQARAEMDKGEVYRCG
jgi:hypothetical protein